MVRSLGPGKLPKGMQPDEPVIESSNSGPTLQFNNYAGKLLQAIHNISGMSFEVRQLQVNEDQGAPPVIQLMLVVKEAENNDEKEKIGKD